MSLTYDYHSSSHANNGNVYQIANGRDSNRTQNFLYDSLNRIAQAYTSGTNWGETFSPNATAPGVVPTTPGIDAWGSLTNRSGVTGKTLYESLNAAPGTTTNQLTGYGYDAAGNMISNGTATYTYDAENRLTSTAGCTFTYDGDGRRVQKTGCASIYYWRDLAGNPLEESTTGTMVREYVFFGGERVARRDVSTNTVHYVFSDHLGSTSLVTDAVGTMPPQSESDYYPYGGEIVVTTPTIQDQNYKFTGKERDSQSGLDNFDARYDASNLGRFMTPTPAVWGLG
jgi:RHS repeat-associated protein